MYREGRKELGNPFIPGAHFLGEASSHLVGCFVKLPVVDVLA